MSIYDVNYLRWFDKHGKARPSHEKHGTEEAIREQLTPLNGSNWRLEGNKLIADTEQGILVQFIDPGYICKGTDKKGLPILERISL